MRNPFRRRKKTEEPRNKHNLYRILESSLLSDRFENFLLLSPSSLKSMHPRPGPLPTLPAFLSFPGRAAL